MARRRPLGVAALALGLGLGACTSLGPGLPALPRSPSPPPRPAAMAALDPASTDLAQFYRQIETERVARGLMRRDTDAATPTPARLAETWIAVALRDEAPTGRSATPSVLRRWTQPVRFALDFGDSVPQATRSADRASVSRLAARLAAASGHPVSLAPPGGDGNFHVLVMSESERRVAGPQFRALVPGIDERTVRLLTDMPRDTFCMVIAFSRDGTAVYSEALAVIRAEHPDLTRLACYHEELTQGLGLAADTPQAWPSIFNDDQEFALITDHDLLLLRLHYDPRLSSGMTESTARPLIFSIASEVLGGAS